MSTIRVFLRWCGSIEAVDPNLYTKVMVPQVPPRSNNGMSYKKTEQRRFYRTSRISPTRRSSTYCSPQGRRNSDRRCQITRSPRCRFRGRILRFSHRPETGTPLKNGTGGERLVAISPGLAVLLEDYIENTRPNQTDDAGREPLLTSRQGRLSVSSMRRYVYNITAPASSTRRS